MYDFFFYLLRWNFILNYVCYFKLNNVIVLICVVCGNIFIGVIFLSWYFLVNNNVLCCCVVGLYEI